MYRIIDFGFKVGAEIVDIGVQIENNSGEQDKENNDILVSRDSSSTTSNTP